MTTAPTGQPGERSKTGCWTCRLRRKKCSEGGPPCSSCVSRGVFCHGYGAKPEWKDRGELERQQASMLKIKPRTRRQNRQASQESQEHGLSRVSTASSVSNEASSQILQHTGTAEADTDLPASPLSHSRRHSNGQHLLLTPGLGAGWDDFDLSTVLWANQSTVQARGDMNGLSDLQQPNSWWDNLDFPDNSWTKQVSIDNEERIGCQQTLGNPSSSTGDSRPDLTPVSPVLHETNLHQNSVQLARASQVSTSATLFPSWTSDEEPADVKEREVELLMQFIEETFGLQHPSYRESSALQRGWLLLLMSRSYTFYYASLSISAYHCFINFSTDKFCRDASFRDYQKHRARALKAFKELPEPEARGALLTSFPGEVMICGIQIALLEALGKNMQECQSHLTLSARYFRQNREMLAAGLNRSPKPYDPEAAFVTEGAASSFISCAANFSPMERRALQFFRALLVWNDTLSCALQTRVPQAAQEYRVLLADEEFAEGFRDITGCESWILPTIMDATALEIWKHDQDAQGALSVRELVSKAEKIEIVLEKGIEKLAKALQHTMPISTIASATSLHLNTVVQVQTYIFAHSVLVHLHTVVSRPWPGVPEVRQSVDRSVSAWEICPSALSLRTLAWPFCVCASLAVGTQREVFQKAIAKATGKGQILGDAHHLETVAKECWKSFDNAKSTRAATCDWKEIVQKLNLGVLFP